MCGGCVDPSGVWGLPQRGLRDWGLTSATAVWIVVVLGASLLFILPFGLPNKSGPGER